MWGSALLAIALACDSRPEAVADGAAALPLEYLPFAEISAPASSLPTGLAAEVEIALDGWQLVAADGASGTFVLDLERIVPDDAALVDPLGRVLERSREDQRPQDARASSRFGIWKLAGLRIELTVPEGAPELRDGTHHLRFRGVSELEAGWNRGARDPREFVRRQVTVEQSTRRGLLLPAPAHVAWDLEVPPAAELHLRAGLLRPATR